MSADDLTSNRDLARALPNVHERENLRECRNANAATHLDVTVDLRAFGDALTVSRCAQWPGAEAQNFIFGWRPGEEAALDEALAWIDEAGAATHVRCPGAMIDVEPSRTLIERGFALQEIEAWLWARPHDVAPPRGDADVRTMRAPEEITLWAHTGCEGWDIPAAERPIWRASLAPEPPPEMWRYFLAYRGDEPAGAALLTYEEEAGTTLGYLADGSVAPAHRGHGLQRDLISARVAAAREHGVDLIFAGARWGSASQRNMERCGLRVAEACALWRRATRGSG